MDQTPVPWNVQRRQSEGENGGNARRKSNTKLLLNHERAEEKLRIETLAY